MVLKKSTFYWWHFGSLVLYCGYLSLNLWWFKSTRYKLSKWWMLSKSYRIKILTSSQSMTIKKCLRILSRESFFFPKTKSNLQTTYSMRYWKQLTLLMTMEHNWKMKYWWTSRFSRFIGVMQNPMNRTSQVARLMSNLFTPWKNFWLKLRRFLMGKYSKLCIVIQS